MKIDTGGPARPTVTDGTMASYTGNIGMTWVDECAMRAMADVRTEWKYQNWTDGETQRQGFSRDEYLARRSYEIARLMLAEKCRLEKQE